MFRDCRRSAWSFVLAFLLLPAVAALAHAQAAVITGRVTGEQGNPLEIGTVFITEMNIATQTDAAGRYTITIPAERVQSQSVVLRARRIGYVAQARPITVAPGPQTQDFALRQDINRLSDVVVTGVTAGTEQRKIPFAVTTLSAEDMPVASSNALAQLRGKVPGAQIVMPSGRPGEAPSIVLRGPKSLDAGGRSQGPLIIVDGVILGGGTQDINPHDIASIEVVKGAAGSSLYGSRAGAGVIQITTKSGANAPAGLRFNIRNEAGFSDIQGAYPFAARHFVRMDETNRRMCIVQSGVPGCSRTVDFEEEALRINEQGGEFALDPFTFDRDYGIGKSPGSRQELKGIIQINRWPRAYDPIEQSVTAGLYNQTNLDMSGRFANTGFFVSGSHEVEEGAIKFLDGDTRSSARVNIDQRIGEHWNAAITTFYSRRTRYPSGSFFRLTRVPAGVNLLRRDAEGRLFVRSNPLNQGGQNANPLFDHDAPYGVTRFDRYIGSLTLRYDPLEWLNFEGIASIDRDRNNGISLQDRGYRSTSASRSGAAQGFISASSNAGLSYNLGLSGTASHDFTPDLLTRLNVRYTYEQEDNEGLSGSGSSLAVPGLLDLDNATASLNIGSSQTTVRAMGASVGANVEYLERYILDGVYRVDGSSLFGVDNRWADYYRASAAWRISEEPIWPLVDAVSDLKLRASIGTAGGRPRFVAQYETFNVGQGGLVEAEQLGNRFLKPETTTETEFGVDAEFFRRFGLNLTYARAITRDQILEVNLPSASGFSSQFQNAGTLDSKTWELSLNVPIVTTTDVTWSSRVSWDRTRTFITELGVPAFTQSNESYTSKFAVGEEIGTIYGRRFVTRCSELPADFVSRCGPGREWQQNDEGFVVWVGEGNTWREGITKNLWQAELAGCTVNGVGRTNITGEVACRAAGGTVNAPWGLPRTHWGMLTKMRDSTATPALLALGNTLPDYRLTLSQSFQWRKLNIYGLVDRSVGNKLMNEELHWSLGDFMVREEDQSGKTVETAKPIGYYWRAPAPDAGGVGGLYDVLGANNHTTEDGSYTKIREVSVSYNIGQIPYMDLGDWSVTLTGKNLYTFTKFKGWDPEVGDGGGNLGSAALSAVAAYQYPPRRTFSFTLNSRF